MAGTDILYFRAATLDELQRAEAKFYTAAKKKGILSAATKKWGVEVGDAAQKRIKALLAKGGTYKIGVSGTAANNISMETTEVAGIATVRVIEGDLTVANEAIRKGIRPGRDVSVITLQEWAVEKGYQLQNWHKVNYEIPVKAYSRTVNGKTVDVKAHHRINRKKKAKYDLEPYYRLKAALLKEGTFRAPRTVTVQGVTHLTMGSNWYVNSPYPVKQGRFDYPAHFVQHEKSYIQSVISRSGDKVLEFIAGYIMSGRKGTSNPEDIGYGEQRVGIGVRK